MARPIYETDFDKRAEQEIADAFANRWNVQFFKNRPLHPIDRSVLRDGVIVAWAEIKRRYRNIDAFDTLFLSAEKAAHGVNLSALTGLPFLFIVRFDDCDAHVRVEKKHLQRLTIMGRADRGDDADREAAIEIPTSELKRWTPDTAPPASRNSTSATSGASRPRPADGTRPASTAPPLTGH